MGRRELTLGIPGHARNGPAVASPNAMGEQQPEFKNTPKDCFTTVQLKRKLFFFSMPHVTG